MERAIEILIVIQLAVIGLSHMAHHRGWAAFYEWLSEKGDAGAFAIGFLSLTVGSLIVAFHHVWSGLPLVLTVFGVLNLVRAATCFLLPGIALRSMRRISVERSRIFIPSGAVALALAAVIAFGMTRST